MAVAGEDVIGPVLNVASAGLDSIVPCHCRPKFRVHVPVLASVFREVGREAALLQENSHESIAHQPLARNVFEGGTVFEIFFENRLMPLSTKTAPCCRSFYLN